MPVREPDNARPGTGRCFMSRTATDAKRLVLQKDKLHLHRYFSSKPQKHKYKNIDFVWADENDEHATNKCYWNICSLKQVWFSSPSLSESASIFLILTTCFFGGMMSNFDINVFIIARVKSAAHRTVPMFSYTDAGRRLHDTWPRKWKFLKIFRCPSDN